MNDITERLFKLCELKGVVPTNVLKELGISTSSFTEWKKGKASPGLKPLMQFSEYFDVSMDYLVFGKESGGSRLLEFSNPREAAFVRKFNQLTTELQDSVLTYMDGMITALNLTVPEEQGKKSLA